MNLITGGSGFVGINIARKLIEKGEKVRILDIVAPDLDVDGQIVQYVNSDIRDRQKVIDACRGVRNIYHIVSLVPISKAGKKFWDVNVGGTENILEGAMKYGAKKIVHMSSSAIYDLDQPNPLNEESPIKPCVTYGRSKYDGEKVCERYRRQGLDITIVRPRTVVGAERLGIFGILYDWVMRGKNIYIIGKGDNKIQFIHVEELADACILMAEKPGNSVFNIGTDKFNNLREDLEALISFAGTNSKVVSINPAVAIGTLRILDKFHLSPLADWHYLSYHKDFYFDMSKVKNELGWSPKYSNSDMLIESYQWYVAHRSQVEKQLGTTHRKAVRQCMLSLVRYFS
jgi:nucleoside-diphosphate-sugar epimerase